MFILLAYYLGMKNDALSTVFEVLKKNIIVQYISLVLKPSFFKDFFAALIGTLLKRTINYNLVECG